jgi:hypothetical protein
MGTGPYVLNTITIAARTMLLTQTGGIAVHLTQPADASDDARPAIPSHWRPSSLRQRVVLCRRGDTNPKYIHPLDRLVRRRMTRNTWSHSHDRVSGTHSIGSAAAGSVTRSPVNHLAPT